MSDLVAGDVDIRNVTLKSIDGCREYDIRMQVQMIDIFESVLSPTIMAEIHIKDSVGLYTNFPLLREEYVQFEFFTPGYDNVTRYDLYVTDIVGMTMDENMKSMSYILRCCSKELITNNLLIINQKFKKEASSIVEEIFQTCIKSEKPLSIVNTKGIEEETITQQTPFQAIDRFRMYATAADNVSSAFVLPAFWILVKVMEN